MIPHFNRQDPPLVESATLDIQESIDSSLPREYLVHLKPSEQFTQQLREKDSSKWVIIFFRCFLSVNAKIMLTNDQCTKRVKF